MTPRAEELVSLVAGELSPQALAERHQVSPAEVERWRAAFVAGMRASAAGAGRLPRRAAPRWALALGLVAATGAFAQLVTFAADTPAVASEVNGNFNQLKAWLEQKVGTAGSAQLTVGGQVRIQTGPTSNVTAAGTKPFFISGNVSDGASNSGGFEFRHDNLSQGIGLGFNTVYATGSSPDQALQLKALGNSSINLLSGVVASGNLTANSNVWDSSADTGEVRYTSSGALSWTVCSNGQYVCGVGIGHTANDANYWTGARLAVRCCSL